MAICFGRDGEIFASGLEGEIEIRSTQTLREAFDLAVSEARSGETVLLSPAAASFDEFLSFEDRGDHFRNWVKSLLGSPS
jgi:UDP-N-acetylmuramoylalanine--D-glutamate ligase